MAGTRSTAPCCGAFTSVGGIGDLPALRISRKSIRRPEPASLTAVKEAMCCIRNSCAMEDAITLARRRARWVGLCLGILAAVAAIAAALLVAQKMPARAADLLLIYVGADDCAPCRAWQNGDGADFRKSAEFAHISYREVKSPNLHDVLSDEHWPEEIRVYRSRLKRSDGVPLWLIVSGNDVVAQRFGAAAWHASVLPKLRSYLR